MPPEVVEALHNGPGKPDKKTNVSAKKRRNGGKYGFDDYIDAPTTVHEVTGCQAGDLCEACGLGRYYAGEARKKLSFSGGALIQVERHLQKTLRCNQCGHEKMHLLKIRKWTSQARSNIIVHKLYGLPWHRMARLQNLYGVPLPASTLWKQAQGVWTESAQWVAGRLHYFVANSSHWQADDTGNKILSVTASNKHLAPEQARACHTTGICARHGDYKIQVYITTNQYCLENVKNLLDLRVKADKVILTTDASSQSVPNQDLRKQMESTLCLGGHAHRKFKDLQSNYPAICHYFMTLVHFLYVNERACQAKTPTERLDYHQKHSQVLIDAIYEKITELFEKRQVEPNSDLGKAIRYWLKHRTGLTAFLRIPSVPLDTNWVERSLRLLVRYRKNSLFFKTKHSALVLSDLFSVVATCEVNGINAFEYLNWLQEQGQAVENNPDHYLPWCFKQYTEAIAA